MNQARSFPPGVHEQFEHLTDQVIDLYQKWRFYLDLFDNEDAQEIMHDRLPGSFRIIESSVRNDMIVTLYRLADVSELRKGTTKEKRNLTLRSLLDQIQSHCSQAFYDTRKKQLDGLDEHLKPLKEHRNQTVGHNDRDTLLGTRPSPLPKLLPGR